MFQVLSADKGYMVHLLQVTIAKTHSLKESYFKDVLLALSKVAPKEIQLVKGKVLELVPEYCLPVFSIIQVFQLNKYTQVKICHKLLFTALFLMMATGYRIQFKVLKVPLSECP
jgi:hypothetical protein